MVYGLYKAFEEHHHHSQAWMWVRLDHVTGLMDSLKYKTIMNKNGMTSVHELKLHEDFPFQQDKCTSKSTVFQIVPGKSLSGHLNPRI